MPDLFDHISRMAGTVGFESSVPVEQLTEFIKEMRSWDPERWVDLHVRGAGGKAAHYIAFHYKLEDGRKKTRKKADRRILQFLRDRLGTRPKTSDAKEPLPLGVTGYSISTVDAVA